MEDTLHAHIIVCTLLGCQWAYPDSLRPDHNEKNEQASPFGEARSSFFSAPLCSAHLLHALQKRSFLQALLVALDHLLDHLAADRAGLTGGQIAVVAFLEVDADLPWCTPNILKSPFAHVFALRKGGKVALHNVM